MEKSEDRYIYNQLALSPHKHCASHEAIHESCSISLSPNKVPLKLKLIEANKYYRWTNIPADWDGVKDVFYRKVGFHDFDKIEAAKDGLVHGFREIDTTFINELESYLEVMRKGLISAIGYILGLNERSYEIIAAKIPVRTP